MFYIYTFYFSFFAAVMRGRVSYVFSFMFMFHFMLMFMFIPIPMLLLLLMFFCFGFDFDSGFYSYLPLLRVFVSYRKEVVRLPVDLSGRGTEQRFVFFTRIFRHRSGAAQRPTVLFAESTVILRSRAVGCFFMIIFSRLFLDFSG